MAVERIVIGGVSDLARLARFHVTHDSPHEVVAFTVDRARIKADMLDGIPLVPFEDVERRYPPDRHQMLICAPDVRAGGDAVTWYRAAKAMGYTLARYVSTKAITWPGTEIGDNCLIFEGSVLQPLCRIGNDVVIAPGAIVGHHATIGDHCRLAPNVVVLGGVTVGPSCVLGANATIRDGVDVAAECIIGPGVTISRSTRAGEAYAAKKPELLTMTSDEFSPFLTWPVRQAP
jgi:sugar O-acyltransferase (sialic acid O-acetyltransferase NeuD family)